MFSYENIPRQTHTLHPGEDVQGLAFLYLLDVGEWKPYVDDPVEENGLDAAVAVLLRVFLNVSLEGEKRAVDYLHSSVDLYRSAHADDSRRAEYPPCVPEVAALEDNILRVHVRDEREAFPEFPVDAPDIQVGWREEKDVGGKYKLEFCALDAFSALVAYLEEGESENGRIEIIEVTRKVALPAGACSETVGSVAALLELRLPIRYVFRYFPVLLHPEMIPERGKVFDRITEKTQKRNLCCYL